jgi:death-on-curing protein
MSDFNYFELKHAIIIHDKIIEITGGLHGNRDIGLLESLTDHVRNDTYYPKITDKLTHIVYSIAMGHAFNDGNKRSSIALGGLFLVINGYGRLIGTFFVELENIVLWLAEHKIDKNFLFEIIKAIVEYGELSEEIKLKLVASIEKKE